VGINDTQHQCSTHFLPVAIAHRLKLNFKGPGPLDGPLLASFFVQRSCLCRPCPFEKHAPPPPPPTTFGGWTGTRKHPVDVSKFYLFVVRVVLQHFRAIKIVQWPGHFAWPIEKLGHSLFGRIF